MFRALCIQEQRTGRDVFFPGQPEALEEMHCSWAALCARGLRILHYLLRNYADPLASVFSVVLKQSESIQCDFALSSEWSCDVLRSFLICPGSPEQYREWRLFHHIGAILCIVFM